MYLLNKFLYSILILLFTMTPIFAQKDLKKRLQLNYIERPHMNYMRALLEIRTNKKEDFLALDLILNNMLNRELINKDKELLKNLAIMGNDYIYKSIPGGFLIEIKFLPEHIKYFEKFLDNFYNYKNFDKLNFLIFIANYWEYFYKRDWRLSLAWQSFWGNILSSSPTQYINSSKDLLSLKYEDMLSAYKRLITPYNSKLYIMGNLSPYKFCSVIRKILDVSGNSINIQFPFKKNLPKKNIVFRGEKILDNQIFIFKSFITQNDRDYIAARFYNSIILSYPYGKLYKLKQKWSNISILGEEYNFEKKTILLIRIQDIPSKGINSLIKDVQAILNSDKSIDMREQFLQQQLRFMVESLKIESSKSNLSFNMIKDPLIFYKIDRTLYFSLINKIGGQKGINIQDTGVYMKRRSSFFKNSQLSMIIFSNSLKINKNDKSITVINLDKL